MINVKLLLILVHSIVIPIIHQKELVLVSLNKDNIVYGIQLIQYVLSKASLSHKVAQPTLMLINYSA
jgi:hypothetical protein